MSFRRLAGPQLALGGAVAAAGLILPLTGCGGGGGPPASRATQPRCRPAMPPGAVPVHPRILPPQGCIWGVPSRYGVRETVIEDQASFVAVLRCKPGTPSGVDFRSSRVVVSNQGSAARVSWYRLPGGDLVRRTDTWSYCGGAAPTIEGRLDVVPRAARVIEVRCRSGPQGCGPGPLPP